MVAWVVIYRPHPRRSPLSRRSFHLSSHLSLFTVAHPLSLQPLTKCSSRNSFVFKTIHFDGGVYTPSNEEIMNSTTANSSSTIEIPAVTSKNDSSSPRPVPPASSISGTRSGASRAARPRPSTGGRCQHLFPNGKRCRKYATDSHFGLCLHHFTVSAALGAARQQDQSDFTDLSADLLPELSEFSAGADIRQFLARLLTLVTKGRISPRRASVLAYITNQLLHSHRAIFLETTPADDHPQVIVDIPRPNRDWPDPEPALPSHHAPPSHPVMSWVSPAAEAPSAADGKRP